jgi:hypothetical protein
MRSDVPTKVKYICVFSCVVANISEEFVVPIFEVKDVNGIVFFEPFHVVAHKIKKGSLQLTQHSPFSSNTIKIYRLQACFIKPSSVHVQNA